MPKEVMVIQSPFNLAHHGESGVRAEIESHVVVGKPILTINISGRRPAKVTMLLDEAKRFAAMIFGMSEDLAEKEAPSQMEIMPGDLVKCFDVNYAGEIFERSGNFEERTHKISRTRSKKEGYVRIISYPGSRSHDYKLELISFHSRPKRNKKE